MQKWAADVIIRRMRKGYNTPLLADMGTGKTRITIRAIEVAIRELEARMILIVAPLTAMHVWTQGWHEWGSFPIAFIDLHDTGTAGLKMARKLAKDGHPVICLVNYESAWQIGYKRVKRMRRGQEVGVLEQVDKALHSYHWDIAILDEATAIKRPGSVVSKFFRTKLRPKVTYRFALTGTAYKKRPLDVWAPVTWCCDSKYWPRTFGLFKAMYAVPHPHIPSAVVGYKNLDDLAWRLSKMSILLKKEDVVDLPPVTHETRVVTLCPKTRRVYDTLREEMIVELEGMEEEIRQEWRERIESAPDEKERRRLVAQMEGRIKTVTISHAFALNRKLMQVTSGFVYPDRDAEQPDEMPVAVRLSHEKVDETIAFLEERDSPTVIVTQANEEEVMLVEAIQKKFGLTPKVLNGSVKGAATRHEMIRAAANDPAFIVKESVAAMGVDMRWTDCIFFFSHSYNTEDYAQMLARNHRGGQTKPITYVHLLAQNTTDMHVMRSLLHDQQVADSIDRDWRKLLV